MDSEGKKKDKKYIKCRICLENVGFSSNTTNLGQHVEIKHPEIVPTDGESSTDGSQTTMEQFTKYTTHLPSSDPRSKLIPTALADFIAKDLRLIATIEGLAFRSFLEV